MYLLVLFLAVEIVTVGALEDAGFQQVSGHFFSVHPQIGRAELVGRKLNRFGITVVGLAIETDRRGNNIAGRKTQGGAKQPCGSHPAGHVQFFSCRPVSVRGAAGFNIHFKTEIRDSRCRRNALDDLLALPRHAELLPRLAVAHLVANVVKPAKAVEHRPACVFHVAQVGLDDQDIVAPRHLAGDAARSARIVLGIGCR